jgi:hypothetical protein
MSRPKYIEKTKIHRLLSAKKKGCLSSSSDQQKFVCAAEVLL